MSEIPSFKDKSSPRLEDTLLLSELAGAESEVSVRQSEVEEARNESIEAQFRVEEIRAELEQAQVDSRRLKDLAAEGAVPRRDSELAQTRVRTLEQQLRSAQEQVRIRDRAITSAQQRVGAQEAVVDGVRQRLSYTDVPSPLNAVVLERLLEPGDIVQTGDIILELGDFSEVEVRIEIPDRDRSQISLGQSVDVRLDAFPNQAFSGQVSRIFPNADPVARLIPVQITLRNPQPGSSNPEDLYHHSTLSPKQQFAQRVRQQAETSAQELESAFLASISTNLVAVLPFLMLGALSRFCSTN